MKMLFFSIVRNVVCLSLGLFGGVAAFGWYRGWTTGFEYGGGVVLIGMLLLVFGIFSSSYQWRSSSVYHQPRKYGEAGDMESSSRIASMIQRFQIPLHFVLVGVVAIVAGSVVQTVFR